MQVHISDVALCGDIHLRRDITMVEDDHRPAGRRLFTRGNSHQRIDLQSFGEVRYIIAVVIAAWRERLFDGDVAAWELGAGACFRC